MDSDKSAASKNKRRLLPGCVLVPAYLLLLLLVCEGTARLIHDRIAKEQARRMETGERSMDQPWQWYDGFHMHPPSASFDFTDESGKKIHIETDRFGLRNDEKRPEEHGGCWNVIVLGDSFVEAVSTEYERTFCRELERRLSPKGIKVINAGVGGYSNKQAFLLLSHLFDRVQPDAVLLMAYLGNNLRDNYWEGEPSKGEDRTPSRSGLLRWSRLLTYLAGPPEAVLPSPTESPLQDYFFFEVETYRNRPAPFVEDALDRTQRILRKLRNFCETRGTPLAVAGIPSKAMVCEELRLASWFEHSQNGPAEGLDVLRDEGGFSFDRPSLCYDEICKGLGIPYEPLLPVFRRGASDPLYHQIDAHWNARGQALAAEWIASRLGPLLEPPAGLVLGIEEDSRPDDAGAKEGVLSLNARLEAGITLDRAFLDAHRLLLTMKLDHAVEKDYKFFVHVYDAANPSAGVRALYDFDPPAATSSMQEGKSYLCKRRFPEPLPAQGALVKIGLFDESDPAYPRLMDEKGCSEFTLRYAP